MRARIVYLGLLKKEADLEALHAGSIGGAETAGRGILQPVDTRARLGITPKRREKRENS